MEADLRPYLTYSVAAHVLLAAAALKVLYRATAPAAPVYTIDFVGPSASILTSGPSPAAAKASSAASRPEPETPFDEFGRRRRKKGAPLPRPSLLHGVRQTPAPEASPETAPAASAPAASPGNASTGERGPGGEAGIATDMPNFPYPWYISQVRSALWQQWSARMPHQAGECIVMFSLLPNGSLTDLRTEQSSGDAAFDLAAMAAVQDAAPFPALPRGFSEPFLKIHVTLKAQ